jgi:beta-lactamase class A
MRGRPAWFQPASLPRPRTSVRLRVSAAAGECKFSIMKQTAPRDPMMELIQQRLGGFLILILLICCPHALWGGRTAARAGDLESKVAKLVEGFTGSVGIYANDLNTGREFAYHADDLFATASVFKVPVLVELFRRAEAGELRLDDRRRVPATGISRHGTGVLRNLRDQPEMTLLDYCRLMVIFSDNIATDTLMQVVDPAAVTGTMKRLGFPNTRVAGDCTTMHYRMFGIDPPVGSAANDELLLARIKEGKRVKGAGFTDRSLNGNVTTPREMGTIFVKLYRGELLAKSSAQMIEILKQTAGRKMAGQLPPEIVVAHKTGGTQGVSSDVGIIYLPQRPIVLSLFLNYDAPDSRASTLIPDLGKLLAEEFPQP